MRVGDACLREAPMLEPWLAYLQHRPGESLRHEVVQYFAHGTGANGNEPSD